MFATPCAMSSTFGLWRSPPMRSATTADMSDSIAPSIATVMAGRRSVGMRDASNAGRAITGSPDGIPPNRVPMVSAPMPVSITKAVPPTRARIVPGTRGSRRRSTRMSASAAMPSAAAEGVKVPRWEPSISIRGTNAAGTAPILRPRKSLICVLAMRTAMPFVNPTTTGRGRYLTAVPMPVAPRTTSSTPAIIVHMNSPLTPCSATMPATTTTNAPVGPPIWNFEPPSAEMMKPVTMAQ